MLATKKPSVNNYEMPSVDDYIQSILTGIALIQKDPDKERFRFALLELDNILWEMYSDEV